MATELDVRPDANPETTSVDGYVQATGNASISSLRGGSGSADANGSTAFVDLEAAASGSTYIQMSAAILLFDVSALPSNAVITGVDIELWPAAPPGTSWDAALWLVSSNPASNTALAAGDYDPADFGSTNFWGAVVSSDFVSGVVEVIPLNANGIAHVQAAADGAGIAKFGIAFESFLFGSSHGSWGANFVDRLEFGTAEQATATDEPHLVITYVHGEIVDETLNLAETNVAQLGLTAVLNEALNLVEGLVASPNLYQIIDEALNMVESIVGAPSVSTVVNETLNMVEGLVNPLALIINRIINSAIRGGRLVQSYVTKD